MSLATQLEDGIRALDEARAEASGRADQAEAAQRQLEQQLLEAQRARQRAEEANERLVTWHAREKERLQTRIEELRTALAAERAAHRETRATLETQQRRWTTVLDQVEGIGLALGGVDR